MRDHAHQDPHLVQPETFPVAAEPVRERVDAQAVVRRREGGDVAGEEGRTHDDVRLRRSKHGEIGRCLGVGLAIVIRVSLAAVQFERKLSGCRHAEERDTSAHRIYRPSSHGGAGRNVCNERTDEGFVEGVFEECCKWKTWGHGPGVKDRRQEGGAELCEKVVHVIGVLSAIDNSVVVLHHKVESLAFLRLALTCFCDTGGRASFLSGRGIC